MTAAASDGTLLGMAGGKRGDGIERAVTFPERVFLVVVVAVCLGLALSAAYSFRTLARLRAEYLRNRAGDVASALDRSMRGPGMRGPGAGGRMQGMRADPAAWQGAFDEALEAYHESTAFLALLDHSGAVMASAGLKFPGAFTAPAGFARYDGTEIFIYEQPIGPGRQDRPGMGQSFQQRMLKVGIYASSADFIRRQAWFQATVSCAAIAVLLALAYYFLRTLRRFLDLKAREEAGRQLASLGAMAATLAHEIRNPLGAMKGLTQLAQEYLPANHEAQQFMNTVVSEAGRLEKLVTDLLAFARPREPAITEFDFMKLLSDVALQLRARPESAGRNLEIVSSHDSLTVRSDESALRQILLNVVLNALEATPEGGNLTVKVGLDGGARKLQVEVEDSGPGLGGRDPEEFFEPFVTTKAKGTGLGLPVSRRLAATLGGTLTLGERAEGGARCTLTVPIAGAGT